MKKTICSLILLIACAVSFAQTNESVPLPRSLKTKPVEEKKLDFFVGGNINTSFVYNFSIAPEAGIRVTDWFAVGISPRYELAYNAIYSGKDDLQHSFGAGAFVEFLVANYLMFRGGYEFLNFPYPETDANGIVFNSRNNVHCVSLGIGFQSYIASNIRFYGLYIIYPYMSNHDHYANTIPMFARIGLSFDL